MNFIRSIIRRTIYITLGFLGGFSRPVIVILCYHSISNDWRFGVKITEFKKQIEYLIRNYNVISLNDLYLFLQGKKIINVPSVIITFDDGYKDLLSIKDFLFDLKIKPTVFILSSTSSRNINELGTTKKLLTLSDVKKLIAAGWEIGSHTSTHPNITCLNNNELKKEILGSKSNLEKILKRKIHYFAYPKGRYNTNIANFVKNSGYRLGLSMDDKIILPESDRYTIPRIGVDSTHSFFEFKFIMLTVNIYFRRLVKLIPILRDSL